MNDAVTVGSSWCPAVGQTVCGDVCAVIPHARGTLICLADGLGHGEDANKAAMLACSYAREHAAAPLETLMRGLDRALVGTRGAAVSLVVLKPQEGLLQFVGIGNVELRAVARIPIAPPSMPGIVGRGLRNVRIWEYVMSRSDLVVLMSDGISTRFDLGAFADLAPQVLAEALVQKHHKTHDDACCVVARVGAS